MVLEITRVSASGRRAAAPILYSEKPRPVEVWELPGVVKTE